MFTQILITLDAKIVNTTQRRTLITLLIKKSAEALQNLCSTTWKQERGFGMIAQGQARREEKMERVTWEKEKGN